MMMGPQGRLAPSTIAFTVLAACASQGELGESESAQASHTQPKARLSLDDKSASIAHGSIHDWSLTKTGAVDQQASTVTWNIVATELGTTSKQIVLSGRVRVVNTGNAAAPIGNVVIQLQHRPGNKWITLASNVADATAGDAATSARRIEGSHVVTIHESAASGSISLARTGSGTPIALSPQVSMPAGALVLVDFSASFDNDVLALPVGRRVRAVVAVSYGNAGSWPNSKTNVDIDGSGSIDPNEARVATDTETFAQKHVPAPTPISSDVTLTDALADITTTGTVTFDNAVFDLGAITGTVTVSYDAGSDGGTITNCAHLTGPGVNIDACDTQDIAAEFEWHDGDVIGYSQSSWGDPQTQAAVLLQASYGSVYASTLGILEVGIPGAAGFSMRFGSSPAVQSYLPAAGPNGPLTSDLTDPTLTPAGTFGGNVVALQLNVDFADSDVLLGTSGVAFGDLTLCNFTSLPLLDGTSVRDFLGEVSSLLGGGTASYGIAELAPITIDLNLAFDSGVVSQFARDHVVIGACP